MPLSSANPRKTMKADSHSGHGVGSGTQFGFKPLRRFRSPNEPVLFDISIIERCLFLTAWLATGLCQGQCQYNQPITSTRKVATLEMRPGYEVVDENGKALSLFSDAAYRAEFRFLRREFQKTDLAGSAVVTDG